MGENESVTYCMGCAMPFPGGGPGVVFCPSCAARYKEDQGRDEPQQQTYNTNDPSKVDTSGFNVL